MPDISARLNLPYLLPSQAQKHVTHNEALILLDALVQTGVESFDATTPPADPAEGALYALGSGAAGDWAGQDGMLALRDGSGWRFIAPRAGWRAWDLENARLMVSDGTDWTPVLPDLNNLDGIGIGTSWDSVNRLAVTSEASLLTHAGSGHQLKINKAGLSDTASLLFQTNWTGHAEMGLAGDNAFSVKLSADGSAWTEALKFDPATGTASGAAIQQAADDTTAGRLMRADYGYGPGNVLGGVSETGGTPTGAVIERGSTADGEYVRWADGTQICWIRVGLVYDSAMRLKYDWTFPVPFDGAGFPVVTANLENEFGATPGPDNLHGPFARQGSSPSTTGCSLRVYRTDGAADFAPGDSLPVQAMAIGRWF